MCFCGGLVLQMKHYARFRRIGGQSWRDRQAAAESGAALAPDCLKLMGSTALAMILAYGLVCAPVTAQASIETRRFDDWELVCRTPDTENGNAAQEMASQGCRISQRLAIAESGETVFLLTGLPGDDAGSFVAIVSVPLRGYLAPGIELRVDSREPVRILYETCDPSGCHAGFPLEGAVLQAFRAGMTARFRVWTARDEPVDLDISLIGFTAAFEALREHSS